MEFNSLMRRVAEFSEVDAGEIEPEARLAGIVRGLVKQMPMKAAPRAAMPLHPPRNHPPPRPSPSRGEDGAAPAPGGERPAYPVLTPKTLAAARIEAARNAKFDHAKYRTLRTIERLNACSRARAKPASSRSTSDRQSRSDASGVVRIFARSRGERGLLCAAWPPPRRGGRRGRSVLSAISRPTQITERAALDALKPVLTDTGMLKIGHDLKFAWQIFAQRGIEIAPYDDIMLMSYALDAGRQNHALEKLAESRVHPCCRRYR